MKSLPNYKYCPKCAGSLEFIIPNEYEEHKQLVCSECGFVFYQNSKPTAGAIIVDKNDNILLAKRAYKPKAGYWDVPGGFLEYGEDPEEAVKREIREELNVEIEITQLVGVYSDYYSLTEVELVCIYYTAKITSGTPTPSSDIADCEWFHYDKLPKEFAFKNNVEALRDFKEMYKKNP